MQSVRQVIAWRIHKKGGLVHAGELLLDVRDGAARVEVLGADLGAVHDGVAPVQL